MNKRSQTSRPCEEENDLFAIANVSIVVENVSQNVRRNSDRKSTANICLALATTKLWLGIYPTADLSITTGQILIFYMMMRVRRHFRKEHPAMIRPALKIFYLKPKQQKTAQSFHLKLFLKIDKFGEFRAVTCLKLCWPGEIFKMMLRRLRAFFWSSFTLTRLINDPKKRRWAIVEIDCLPGSFIICYLEWNDRECRLGRTRWRRRHRNDFTRAWWSMPHTECNFVT